MDYATKRKTLNSNQSLFAVVIIVRILYVIVLEMAIIRNSVLIST